MGQASLSGYKIEVRSAEDDEKDAVAKAGQARSKLYFVGSDADWAKGTITWVCESVSESLKVIHAKLRSAQVDATQSMLKLAVETAKSEDPTSIYSKFASIDVVKRATAANLLGGNLQFALVTGTWSNAELHDITALLP